ncbi:MAG: hypothetical protein A3E36_00025 [Candidatus Andersenbacteria bacterium RIFCSPHIGHO2_12_FULL_45_11b]|uniref:Uncharacterized protein n=1 Tax=Candidatus Andersenbacteria bacterium RIFCSPHIGHO2_12_FULL_45_11b TaxID=1797282 RepID=A0A1G1X6P3_9BACT|nr:MAG: hypothetical protein A3E36_00025 [Candidatus Andersenbacteria bacterium RIFCSPHIGHO2_12_FULL_45_11b]
MLLQRRLLIQLENYRIKKNKNPTRGELVEMISKGIWPRWNYFSLKNDAFKRKIDIVLGDCIRGTYEFATEDEGGKNLLVTLAGREFIEKSRLFEEILKRHKRTSEFLTGGAVGAVIGWVFSKLGQ